MIHANTEFLTGQGKWGSSKLKVILTPVGDVSAPEELVMGLGDKTFDLEGRQGSMPKFRAQYKKIGEAKCSANLGS